MLRESQLHLPQAGFSPIYKVKHHHQKRDARLLALRPSCLFLSRNVKEPSSRHIHSEIFFE